MDLDNVIRGSAHCIASNNPPLHKSPFFLQKKEDLKKELTKKREILQGNIQRDVDRMMDRYLSSSNNQAFGQCTSQIFSKPSNQLSSECCSSTSTQSEEEAESFDLEPGEIYCVCNTVYDETKFYLACDICDNWFHGSCVDVTLDAAREMTRYECLRCRMKVEEVGIKEKDICLCCMQPVNVEESSVGCDKCLGWLHCRCVGILSSEIENIPEYICPMCNPETKINSANLKALTKKDDRTLKKMLKQIKRNKNSFSFLEPVDADRYPTYYQVIKEPIDFGTIELRVDQAKYKTLSQFIGDICRIFENCRFANLEESSYCKDANKLQVFISEKLELLRKTVLANGE